MATQTTAQAQAFIAFEAAFLHVIKGFGSATVDLTAVSSDSVTVKIVSSVAGYNVSRSIEVAKRLISENTRLDERTQDMVICQPINKETVTTVKLVF